MSRRVLNTLPSFQSSGPRIALVGEAPGENEESQGKPFVGYSGQLLDQMCAKAGIIRASCLVGNVFQYRPPGNKIELVDKTSPFWVESVEQLRTDLKSFQPNLIVAMGNTALECLCDKRGITNWRGSILPSTFIPV